MYGYLSLEAIVGGVIDSISLSMGHVGHARRTSKYDR